MLPGEGSGIRQFGGIRAIASLCCYKHYLLIFLFFFEQVKFCLV